MKLTISNKLIIAFSLMACLVMLAGGSGLFGSYKLNNITQFLINEAWDTADGAMEGTINLQKQVILVEQVLAADNHQAEWKKIKSELSTAQNDTTEALTRLSNAGLMEENILNELNQSLAQFYSAQQTLLGHIINTNDHEGEAVQLRDTYSQARQHLIEFLENFESVADSKVENQVSEVDAIISFVDTLIIGALFLGMAATFAIATISKKQISSPIAMTAKRLKEIAHGDGDLTVTLPVKGNDEISELSTNFNVFIQKIRDTIRDVAQASEKISQASGRMSSIATETSEGLNRQHAETEQVASSTNEMASSIEEVARNAAAAASAATSANEEAMKGKDIVITSTENIDSLANQVKQTTEIINHLEDDSNAIGSILDVIRDIAEQTNLLALNAAIEAARAGEMGRGFAVVADEVRNLAQRTQESTREIQDMIQKLQDRAQHAARSMEAGQTQALGTVEQAHAAAEALASIAAAIASINDMNTQIAASAEEQSAVTEEINRNISNITQHAEQTTYASQQTADTGNELATLSNELNQRIRQFKF